MPGESFRDHFEAHGGKVSDKWDLYLGIYEETFAPLRAKPITLLEIGVQNGGSLEVWADYFRDAKAIVGVDINPKCSALSFRSERISIIVGDATRDEIREKIAARSASFDIIIDDGSHVSSDVIATFFRLLPLLGDDGIYVVEDVHASYWKELGGELFAPYSTMAFFKTLTDVLNYEHWSLDKSPGELLQPYADRVYAALPLDHIERIESITFLNSICIVRKTSGGRATLGARRIVGAESNVVKMERFPSKVFSRKAALDSAEDYFWAWQALPPMEALSSRTQLIAALEQRILEQDNELSLLSEQKRALGHKLEQTQQQFEEQNPTCIELQRHLAQMYQSSSWRITRPFRLVKRVARLSWHLKCAFSSNGPFLIRSGLRLLLRMFVAPDMAIATMRRVHADPEIRSNIIRMMGIPPAQYAALSELARRLEMGHRRLRSTIGRRLLRFRFLSGATQAYRKARQRGVYLYLDGPLGVIVPAYGPVTFRGWAVDTNTGRAAEMRLFAGGQPVRVDRHKRVDVTQAFKGQVSSDAKTAFEANVPCSGRLTWVRIELALAPDEWVLVHRALIVGATDAGMRPAQSYEPAEWMNVQRNHAAAQIEEMREHINAMVLHPAFFVVIDSRKSERNLDATIGCLRDQIYRAARVVILARDERSGGNNGTPSVPDAVGETIQRIDHLDVCDPPFAHLDYLLVIEPGDRLEPSALYSFASAINREPATALVYSDELLRTASGAQLPFRKPAWSPDYLESFNYIAHSGVFSMARARQLALPFASIYDFTLRFTESLDASLIIHLDCLLFERAAPFARETAADDDVAAIRGRLERTGRSGEIVPAPSGTKCYHARVRWTRTPEISIIIPTAGYTKMIGGRDIDLIVNITQQIVERSTCRTAEIVVVDNGDLSEHQKKHLAKLGCRRVTFGERAFNVAKKLNLGASVAGGELLILMNDDMEIVQGDWIERLCDHIAKPDVGVVGCKLLYPDRSTQHVGVIHYHGNPDHVRRGYPADDAGYFNSTCGVRNYLAVTGACMLTRKALYRQVGGYSQQLAESYNDADFCLKVRAAGYRIVYTGDAELIHMESLSRVASVNPDEVNYYLKNWAGIFPEDPFYNERFLTLAPPSFEPRTNDRHL